MRVFVSYANGSDMSLMMVRSAERATKELGVPIIKIHHCAISEGESSASQYDVVFTPVNFLQTLQQVEKRGVTATGIKNVMSAKEIRKKYMISDRYQESE